VVIWIGFNSPTTKQDDTAQLMPIIQSPFKPPLLWRNRHLQTLWPSLLRKPVVPERAPSLLTTRDGDEILLETLPPEPDKEGGQADSPQPQAQARDKQAVLLIHGLSGSADSQYIVGLQVMLAAMGVMSVAMNFRGVKSPNNLAAGYHSGSSDDIGEVVDHLQQTHPEQQWHAMGFSLGANSLLKYLGEQPSNPLHSALAVSAPLDLAACSTRIDQGFSKVYRNHLLAELSQYFEKKHQHLTLENPAQAEILAATPFSKKFSSFWDFDHQIVAPLHGFSSAEDYYQRCSGLQFLPKIETPTHILISRDDPFLSADSIPHADQLSTAVTLEVSEYGGHVGFIGGRGSYYIEELVRELLA